MMNPLFWLILMIADVIFWIILISVILSWLVAFNVINLRQPLLGRIYEAITGITERIYAPIRRLIPTVYGGIDISPVIVLIGLQLVKYTVVWLSMKLGI